MGEEDSVVSTSDIQPLGSREITHDLHAVGGAISTDGRQSWVPPESGRWLPMHLFALRDGPRAVVVDGGVRAFRDAIETGLAEVLAGVEQADIVLTRYNFDTLINIPWLCRRFEIRHLHVYLPSNFVLGTTRVMSFMDAFEDANIELHVRSIAPVEPTSIVPGADFTAAGRRMRCLRGPLRLLQSEWVYDYATRTLFCGDAFGCGTSARPDDDVVTRADRGEDVLSRLPDALLHRFGFLAGAETTKLRSDLAEIFDAVPVERLCPSFGTVIEGGDLVAAVRELTDRTLEKLSTATPITEVVGTPAYPTRILTLEEAPR
jgi:hypothetical protein